MSLGVRLQLSILARMCVALALLAVGVLGVALLVGIVGGIVGIYAAAWIYGILDYVAEAPRLSPLTPVPAWAVAGVSGAVVLWVRRGWSDRRPFTEVDSVVRPKDAATVLWLATALGGGYLVVVEGSAALAALIAWTFETGTGVLVVFTLSAVVAFVGAVLEARREVRRLQERLIEDSEPAGETHPSVDERVRRLARHAGIPAPVTRVTHTERPESFAVGTGGDAVVVVSTGLIEALSSPELEAVLAHEVSHLANADSRIVGAALVPVLVADNRINDSPSDTGDYVLSAVYAALKRSGQFGLAVLSRGREWSADAGAVALTGSPAALANALATLHGRRRTPETDLREWEASIAALDILPAVDDRAGPYLTHPPTAARIERLRQIAAAAEQEGSDQGPLPE